MHGPNRRGFMAGLLAASTVPGLSWADAGSPAYLAAAREADGTFAMFGIDSQGGDVFRVPLPARGHAACAHPTVPEAVAFARRPGTYALVIDCVSGAVSAEIEAPVGRHFNGHGIYLGDGDTLCTPENDFEGKRGVIGFWSRKAGYRRIGEMPTGGIGPHDLKRLPDSDVLVVANGGILTHPDKGREKLNLDTMRPNLTYIDPVGGILDQVVLDADLHQNSIRHLDIHPDGTVAFAMQWQGDKSDTVPLLGLHERGQSARLLEAPFGTQMALNGYAGSVSYNGSGDTLAITSPRGGQVHFYGADGGYTGNWKRRDVCGLRAMGAAFLASDGNGALHRITVEGGKPLTVTPRAWDNHIVSL
ncbi:DUF1513 domain-containing protein [Profundibacter sp.]